MSTITYTLVSCMGDELGIYTTASAARRAAREECCRQGLDPDDPNGCSDDGYPSIDASDGERVDY